MDLEVHKGIPVQVTLWKTLYLSGEIAAGERRCEKPGLLSNVMLKSSTAVPQDLAHFQGLLSTRKSFSCYAFQQTGKNTYSSARHVDVPKDDCNSVIAQCGEKYPVLQKFKLVMVEERIDDCCRLVSPFPLNGEAKHFDVYVNLETCELCKIAPTIAI